jgi:hypothetical protein
VKMHAIRPRPIWLVLAVAISCGSPQSQQAFDTPESAVRALIKTVNASNIDELLLIFGTDGADLIASSDPATGRRNRAVFAAAAGEGWQLVNYGEDRRVLVVGNESWPFPIPLVKDGDVWRFDTAAGKEEVLARRIGRNELAVIRICRTYVVAQRLYASQSHDGRRVGLYAGKFHSDPGKQNGLYWPPQRGKKRSPLGDLVAQAEAEGRTPHTDVQDPSPFHGYYFKILTAQGDDAPGGARDYRVGGELSGGFAMVAWPAQYDATGVMTFIVNYDGVVHEKDFGPGSDGPVTRITRYNPDPTWKVVH